MCQYAEQKRRTVHLQNETLLGMRLQLVGHAGHSHLVVTPQKRKRRDANIESCEMLNSTYESKNVKRITCRCANKYGIMCLRSAYTRCSVHSLNKHHIICNTYEDRIYYIPRASMVSSLQNHHHSCLSQCCRFKVLVQVTL